MHERFAFEKSLKFTIRPKSKTIQRTQKEKLNNIPCVFSCSVVPRVEIEDEEDDLIQEYIDDAISYIESYINQRVYENEVPPEESSGTIFNSSMRQAVYLIVGQWYRYREDTATSDMHPLSVGVKQLLDPIRKRNV